MLMKADDTVLSEQQSKDIPVEPVTTPLAPTTDRVVVMLTKDLSDEDLELIMNAQWGQVSK
jgi:hypothetical protein